jgi:hypothetical protein
MGELPRNVREFIVRDLIYIAGGGLVIVSFLYRFDRLPDQDTPLAFYLLGAGAAYVVGSALQDIFSIVGRNQFDFWLAPMSSLLSLGLLVLAHLRAT